MMSSNNSFSVADLPMPTFVVRDKCIAFSWGRRAVTPTPTETSWFKYYNYYCTDSCTSFYILSSLSSSKNVNNKNAQSNDPMQFMLLWGRYLYRISLSAWGYKDVVVSQDTTVASQDTTVALLLNTMFWHVTIRPKPKLWRERESALNIALKVSSAELLLLLSPNAL